MIIDLQPNEQVLKEIRKHWFYLFIQAFSLVIVFLLVAFGIYAIVYFSPDYASGVLSFEGDPGYLFLFLLSALLLLGWISFFSFFTKYYLDYWIITNRRIMDMDLIGFFHENIATIHLHDIEDIEMERRGLFASIFNFGTLSIQSAGAVREFFIRDVPRPTELKDELFRLHEQAMEEPHRVIIAEPT